MRKIQLAIMATALCLALQAQASWYDITFTGTGDVNGNPLTAATAAIDVVGGTAVGGVLHVTTGPAAGYYNLVAGSANDGLFVYDNLVNTASTPFLDSTGGLLWRNASGYELNMWYSDGSWIPGRTYGLWGAPPTYGPEAYGNATLTAAVPEPTTMVAGAGALGLALLGIGRARRSSVVRIG